MLFTQTAHIPHERQLYINMSALVVTLSFKISDLTVFITYSGWQPLGCRRLLVANLI